MACDNRDKSIISPFLEKESPWIKHNFKDWSHNVALFTDLPISKLKDDTF